MHCFKYLLLTLVLCTLSCCSIFQDRAARACLAFAFCGRVFILPHLLRFVKGFPKFSFGFFRAAFASRLPLSRRLDYYTTSFPLCQSLFSIFFKIFFRSLSSVSPLRVSSAAHVLYHFLFRLSRGNGDNFSNIFSPFHILCRPFPGLHISYSPPKSVLKNALRYAIMIGNPTTERKPPWNNQKSFFPCFGRSSGRTP